MNNCDGAFKNWPHVMEPKEPNGQLGSIDSVLKDVAACFEAYKVRYALIGGIATGIRSQIRATEDIDFIVELPQVILPQVLEHLRSLGFELDVQKVIRCWNRDHMVVLFCRGVRVDWLKPVIPLYNHVITNARAESGELGTVRIASPEGLILTKLLAWRTQDQADIERLLAANRGQLDLDHVRSEWEAVGEPDDAKMKRLNEMLAEFYAK